MIFISRYFAYNCKKSFPTVMRGPQRNIDDVICEERYSRVEPSTGGEVGHLLKSLSYTETSGVEILTTFKG